MSKLKTTVEAAKERLNVSMSDLSLMIGKSKNYLSEMINRGCSEEKEREIIAELSQRLADAQDQCIALRAETSRLYAVLSDSKRELEEAAAEVDRAKSIMSFYFLAAVFVGVFIGVFWG